MNPTVPPQSLDDALQNVHNPLKVMQPGEQVLCEIRRHPFGLLGIYGAFLAVAFVAVAAVVAAPRLIPGLNSQDQAIIALGALLVAGLTGLFSYIGAVVYKGNRWIVTTDSITQITQVSLFNKQISQLSLANLEDVTVEQNGIMQTLIGFGRLRAESAGERSKFAFDFCPRPNDYARKIIAAHEAYIATNPDEMRMSNRPLANATSFNQSYAQPQQPYPYNSAPSYGSAQQPMQQAQPYDPTQPYGQQPTQPAGNQNSQ